MSTSTPDDCRSLFVQRYRNSWTGRIRASIETDVEVHYVMSADRFHSIEIYTYSPHPIEQNGHHQKDPAVDQSYCKLAKTAEVNENC